MTGTGQSLEQAIADGLRDVIDRRGLTQAATAQQLGVSAKHLNQVLQCRAHVSIQTLTEWSDRLGIRWEVGIVDLLD